MFAVSEREVMNRGPSLERGLVGGLLQVNTLLNTISVEDSNGGVVITKIFIRPNCDVVVVLVASVIVGSVGKGVSSIGGAWLVFQEDVVLLSFR
jgi:short subunit fatty acids transporter